MFKYVYFNNVTYVKNITCSIRSIKLVLSTITTKIKFSKWYFQTINTVHHLHYLCSVSYTHLDVYKRQPLHR